MKELLSKPECRNASVVEIMRSLHVMQPLDQSGDVNVPIEKLNQLDVLLQKIGSREAGSPQEPKRTTCVS